MFSHIFTSFCTIHQVSPTSSSPVLSNREQYPLFYRTISPESQINSARVRMIQQFGWTRVATIHENHQLFSAVRKTIYLVYAVMIIVGPICCKQPVGQIKPNQIKPRNSCLLKKSLTIHGPNYRKYYNQYNKVYIKIETKAKNYSSYKNWS